MTTQVFPVERRVLSTARETSKFAARTNGSGFTAWGAGMGLNLNSMGTTKSAYDASYAISFSAGANTTFDIYIDDIAFTR